MWRKSLFEDQKHRCVFDSYNFAPLVLFLFLAQSNITYSLMPVVCSAQKLFEVDFFYCMVTKFMFFLIYFYLFVVIHDWPDQDL